jgi:hypothetical protein
MKILLSSPASLFSRCYSEAHDGHQAAPNRNAAPHLLPACFSGPCPSPSPSIFSPPHRPHHGWGGVGAKKCGTCYVSSLVPARGLAPPRLGGFQRRRDLPDDLLSVPAPKEASHSLLHTPKGDPGKPEWEPTFLTLGSTREHQELLRRLPPRQTQPGTLNPCLLSSTVVRSRPSSARAQAHSASAAPCQLHYFVCQSTTTAPLGTSPTSR